MRVCFVTTSFLRHQNDYYARFVFEQAKSLIAADPETTVTVVAPHAAGLELDESIEGVRVLRCRYFWPTAYQCLGYQHEGLSRTMRRSWLGSAQLPCLLFALFIGLWRVSRDAEIIHAQWIPTAAVALIIKWLRGVPVVVSARGGDLNDALGSRMRRHISRLIVNMADHVIAVSDEFRSILTDDIGCKTPVTAIYNGVARDQFKPRSKQSCREKIAVPNTAEIILYVGGLIRRKGVDVLLRAFAEQLKECDALRLYLVGEGPDRPELVELAAHLGVSRSVEFVGAVSRDSTHLWIGAADVLVLPSYSEGRPNVVLEAMASGVPVIATAVNGTGEVITDQSDGMLFEAGDVAGLTACLRKLRGDQALQATLSANGPLKIERLGLTWRNHGTQLLSVYRDILKNRCASL